MRSGCEVLWFRHKMDLHFKAVTKKGQVPSFLHDLNSRSVNVSMRHSHLILIWQRRPRSSRWLGQYITWSGHWSEPEAHFEIHHNFSNSVPDIWNHPQLVHLSLCCWVCGPWDVGHPRLWCPGSVPRAAGLAPERLDDASGMVCFIWGGG